MVAHSQSHLIFVNEIIHTDSACCLGFLNFLNIDVIPLRGKLIYFLKPDLSFIYLSVWLSSWPSHGSSNLSTILSNFEQRLLLEVFLFLDVYASDPFTDLNYGDHDPWHHKYDAKCQN